MKRLFVGLQASALIRGSLPRPWGEGGRKPGEGQPTGIAPQNVQTPERPQGGRRNRDTAQVAAPPGYQALTFHLAAGDFGASASAMPKT